MSDAEPHREPLIKALMNERETPGGFVKATYTREQATAIVDLIAAHNVDVWRALVAAEEKLKR